MRFGLEGYKSSPDLLPPLILHLPKDAEFFAKAQYVVYGYTKFDVMCIGGSGGRGGVWFVPEHPYMDPPYTAYNYYKGGGGGGGGGSHRVSGLLSALPDLSPVQVGSGGADSTYMGNEDVINEITVGGHGEASFFNDDLCQASGGGGGFPGHSAFARAPGGTGGLGGTTTLFTGAVGATTTEDAESGTWDGTIGAGGGGGYGGVFSTEFGDPPAMLLVVGGNGGSGAYSPGSKPAYCPGGNPIDLDFEGMFLPDGYESIHKNIGGTGGGASSFPVSGNVQTFGTKFNPASSGDGAVIIRLT